MAHLKEVAEYCKRFGVSTKFYVNPLNSLRENFFMGGIMFSCVYDKKTKDVFAAGGRYDHLIKEQRPKIGGNVEERHAVGFSLAWERLARTPPNKGGSKTFLKKQESDVNAIFAGKRVSPLNSLPAMIASFALTRQ
jgi:translation initiation factor 2-alpha kinase 4